MKYSIVYVNFILYLKNYMVIVQFFYFIVPVYIHEHHKNYYRKQV